MSRKVCAEISKQALIHNFHVVKQKAPNSKILAMVKANAYGHGIVSVAKMLKAADAFGVANIEEALILRQAGIDNPIVLMEGFFDSTEFEWIAPYQFIPVIHCMEQIEALEAQHFSSPISIWLKMNTGMNRLGFSQATFLSAYERLKKLPFIHIIGFMTHFAQADERENSFTVQQTEIFLDTIKDLPGEKCLANSAGILAWPQTHYDWVRPGLILYGASPFADETSADLNLKPVMQLSAEVISIQTIAKGQRVGYGGKWESQSDVTRIGIVSIGYGDGYPWHAQSGTPILVNRHLTQIVGRVSMDMLAMDLTHLPDTKVGDPVQLWGAHLPIEHVAKGAGTIPYELFCRLTDRVSIHVVD